MHDARGEHGMSEVFRWWLGGLLATAAEFSLLWAPTINSYKRFQPGSWAPTGDRLGPRQPHPRLSQGRSRQGHAGRVPDPRLRRQQLLRLRRHARRRPARHRQPDRAAAGVRRQRLRRHRPAADPVEHRRGDRPVGALGRRQAGASATTSTTTSSTWPSRSGRRSTRRSPTGSSAATGNGSETKGVGVRACGTMNRCERQPARSRRRHRRPARRAPCALRPRPPTGVRLPAPPLRQ